MAVGDYGAGLSPDLWQSLLPYMGGDYSSALSTQNKQMGNIDDIIGLLLSPEFAMLSGTYSAPQMQQFPTSTPKTSVYKNSEFEDIRNIALGIEQGVYDDATAQNMLRQAVLDGRLPGFTTDQTDAMVTQMWDEIRQNEANAIQFYADQEANAASDSVFGQAGLPTGEYFANYSDGNLETNYGGIDPAILQRVLAAQQGIANRTAALDGQQAGAAAPAAGASGSKAARVYGPRNAARRIDAGDVQYVQAKQNAGGIYGEGDKSALDRFDEIVGAIGVPDIDYDSVRMDLANRIKERTGSTDAKFIPWDEVKDALQGTLGSVAIVASGTGIGVAGDPVSQEQIDLAINKAQAYVNADNASNNKVNGITLNRADFTGGEGTGFSSGGYSYDYDTGSGGSGPSDRALNDTYLNLLRGKDRAATAQGYGYARAAIDRGASPLQDALQQRIAMLRAAGVIQ